MADVLLIMQSVQAPDKYTISDQGKLAADVDGKAGLTADDAAAVQKYLIGTVNKLPL